MEFKELWATYSVKDHRLPRAFVADVMLYDRLVIPIPPREGKEHDREWKRWESRCWNPALQQKLLTCMKEAVPAGQGPVVEEVEWDEEHRGQWKERMVAAKKGRPYIRDVAFQETRNVLIGNTPTYTWGVAAIGVAFQSLDDLKRELGFKRQPGQLKTLPSGALAAVIGQEFFVVDDPVWSHEDLLKATIEIATDSRYRGTRAALTNWQQRFLNGDFMDDASIQKAVEEMHGLLNDRHAIVREAKVKTSVHYTFRLGMLPE